MIMSLKHLYRCIDYIHENPIKAGICEDKSDYRFSSFSMLYNNSQENVRKKLLKLKNISFRIMENIIQINRESLRKLLKND